MSVWVVETLSDAGRGVSFVCVDGGKRGWTYISSGWRRRSEALIWLLRTWRRGLRVCREVGSRLMLMWWTAYCVLVFVGQLVCCVFSLLNFCD